MNIPDKYLDFILRHHGRILDFDGRFGGQCVDLYRFYVRDVLGFPQSPGVEGAKDIWNTYPAQYYTKIINGPNNFPAPGDIIIWGAQYGPFGHVAICLYANGSRIVDFSQNDPVGTPCHIQHHTYFGVLGWLKPRVIAQPPEYATLPEGHALRGVHSPADPGDWAYTPSNLSAIDVTNMLAVLVLCPEITPATVNKIRSLGVRFIAARLFAKLDTPHGTTLDSARWFVTQVRQHAIALYLAGVEYFQVANETNLIAEGLGSNWVDGAQFATWYNLVVGMLRADMPNAKFGFPGLSPGGTIPGVRQDSTTFFNQAMAAASNADWLGLHSYWSTGESYQKAIVEIELFANQNKDKVVLVTEFSNPSTIDSKATKGQQYKAFYGAANSLPPNVGALFCFCLSSTGEFQQEVWVEKNGQHSAIVAALS